MSPLMRGHSPRTISDNIREMLETYKRTGKIGRMRPRDMGHARRIAAAIAEEKARGGKR